MNIFPSEEIVDKLREDYPEGTRIALVHMDDPYGKLVPGDRGTVQYVDDAGSIHIRWDCGSGLAVAYGEDSCRKLTEKELSEEQAASEVSGEIEENNKMNVLIVEPDKAPYMKEIDNDLKTLQEVVGGLIQVTYPYEDLVGIICNEECKINGLQLNRAIYDGENNITDIIAGTFIVAELTDDDFCGLSPELSQKFKDMFKYPEIFMRTGEGKIIAVPQKPSVREMLKNHTTEKDKKEHDKVKDKPEPEI